MEINGNSRLHERGGGGKSYYPMGVRRASSSLCNSYKNRKGQGVEKHECFLEKKCTELFRSEETEGENKRSGVQNKEEKKKQTWRNPFRVINLFYFITVVDGKKTVADTLKNKRREALFFIENKNTDSRNKNTRKTNQTFYGLRLFLGLCSSYNAELKKKSLIKSLWISRIFLNFFPELVVIQSYFILF